MELALVAAVNPWQEHYVNHMHYVADFHNFLFSRRLGVTKTYSSLMSKKAHVSELLVSLEYEAECSNSLTVEQFTIESVKDHYTKMTRK